MTEAERAVRRIDRSAGTPAGQWVPLVVEPPDEPLIAEHPEVPAEHALQGFHAARAYSSDPERSRGVSGFDPRARRELREAIDESWRAGRPAFPASTLGL